MTFSTLTSNGTAYRVTRGSVVLPAWGIWSADVDLDTGAAPLSGAVTLAVGPLSLEGTIRRGGIFVGASS